MGSPTEVIVSFKLRGDTTATPTETPTSTPTDSTHRYPNGHTGADSHADCFADTNPHTNTHGHANANPAAHLAAGDLALKPVEVRYRVLREWPRDVILSGLTAQLPLR